MDRMKTIGLHVVRKATGTTDTTNHNEFFSRDTQLRKCFLDGIQNGIVTTSWTPANFVGWYKVLFGKRLRVVEGFCAHLIVWKKLELQQFLNLLDHFTNGEWATLYFVKANGLPQVMTLNQKAKLTEI